ncbi:hypothetical protein EBZ39_15050, partial [bacterium]|nr:hypothetical protein [bacterium]
MKWRSEKVPSKDILYEYKPFCQGLLFEDEEIVREVTGLLRKNIEYWARMFSQVYREERDFISKSYLLEKKNWYVESMMSEAQSMATSGSTTGFSFEYMRWEPFLYFIEGSNHYDLVLDEFEISEKPKILYFFNSNQYDQDKIITVRND